MFGRPEIHDVPYPPGLRFANFIPPVLVSDPSKSGATAGVAVAAAINKPEIELKEANDDNDGGSGGVNFIFYAGAVFRGLILMWGETVLFMDSMTNMERRRGAKQGE